MFYTALATRTYSSRLFFSNATATTDIYTLSLHDALPILRPVRIEIADDDARHTLPTAEVMRIRITSAVGRECRASRSEEHTSELQSHHDLVCRLLLEKKKKKKQE